MPAWRISPASWGSRNMEVLRDDRGSARPLAVLVTAATLSLMLALAVNSQHLDGFAAELCFAIAPTSAAP